MATATPIPRLTYDDLDFIPKEREGDRHELIDGELVVTPSPMPPHQRVSGRLYRWFGNHAEANNLGEVYPAPIDVKFTPPIVAVPDLVFVSRERLGIVGRTAINGTPDLIVEILSPSTRRRDLGVKKALYERFGVPEYWIVDLKRRCVTVCLLRDGRYACVTHTDGRIRPAALPGLAVEVTAIFADL